MQVAIKTQVEKICSQQFNSQSQETSDVDDFLETISQISTHLSDQFQSLINEFLQIRKEIKFLIIRKINEIVSEAAKNAARATISMAKISA